MQRDFRFSVVTPSLNQGLYIRANIESVLRQGFQDFEHIVIDGGSTDETLAILESYSHLNWVSEPDSGQSQAVNKGIAKSSGEIIAWLNSDDWYEPGAFEIVHDFFCRNENACVVMGNCRRTNEGGESVDVVRNYARGREQLRKFWIEHSIPTQPAVFFRRSLIEQFGELDDELHYAMDYDLWLRFSSEHRFYHVDHILANYRFHPLAKGGTKDWSSFYSEWRSVYRKHFPLRVRLKDWPGRAATNAHRRLKRYFGLMRESLR